MSPDCLPSPCRRRYTRAGECVFQPSKGRSVSTVKAYGEKTYTFGGQNVYVSWPKRIRFTLETYTFSSQDVYVLLGIGIRSVRKGYTFSPVTSKVALSNETHTTSPENTLSTCRLHRQTKERIPKARYTTSQQSEKEYLIKRAKNTFSSNPLIDLSTAITTFASVILKLMQYDEIYPPYVSPIIRTTFLR